MPLDRVKGEHVEGLDDDFRIVPLSKWSDTKLWDIACERATQAFEKAGAMIAVRFDQDDVLVQEYPTQDIVCFLFRRYVPISNWKRGEDQTRPNRELFHPVVIGLHPTLKAELIMAGRWQEKTVN